jgi:hypothetical protein
MGYVIRVGLTSIASVLWFGLYIGDSNFNLFALMLSAYFFSMPIVAFCTLVLVPLESLLHFLKWKVLLLVLAPAIGWATPKLVTLAIGTKNAEGGEPGLSALGLAVGVIWCVTFFLVDERK